MLLNKLNIITYPSDFIANAGDRSSNCPERISIFFGSVSQCKSAYSLQIFRNHSISIPIAMSLEKGKSFYSTLTYRLNF